MRWTTKHYIVVDEKTLAEAAINLLKDESRLRERGRSGRRIAEAHRED